MRALSTTCVTLAALSLKFALSLVNAAVIVAPTESPEVREDA